MAEKEFEDLFTSSFSIDEESGFDERKSERDDDALSLSEANSKLSTELQNNRRNDIYDQNTGQSIDGISDELSLFSLDTNIR